MKTEAFSIYFIRGGNPKHLSQSQQLQIYDMIAADPYGQSHLIYSPKIVAQKLSQWQTKLPYITPYYALKSNHYPQLTQTLYKSHTKIDIGSRYQLQLCKQLNIPGEDIIYSNTMKCQEDLKEAWGYGVRLTVADSLGELRKILGLGGVEMGMGVLWRIGVKEKSGDFRINNFFDKFGDQLQTDEDIRKRMKEIKDMGISLKGIHFNTGPEKYPKTGFPTAIKLARRCLQIGREYGHQMSILNLGGGFPAGQLPEKLIQELKPLKDDPLGYQVIAEPGKFFSGEPFYLMARVIGMKYMADRTLYFLNESTYQSFRLAEQQSLHLETTPNQFYSKISPNRTPSALPSPHSHPATLYGMTCSRNDIIAHLLHLPEELEIGDWLCFGGMGAYTVCFSSNYNGMKEGCKVVELGGRGEGEEKEGGEEGKGMEGKREQ